MLLVVGSTGEKPPAGVRESWLFVFLPSDYAPGGGALRTLKTIPPYSAPATGIPVDKWGF